MKNNEDNFINRMEDIPKNVFPFLSKKDDHILLSSQEIETYNQVIAQKSNQIYFLADNCIKKDEIKQYMADYLIPSLPIYDGIKQLTIAEIVEIQKNRNIEKIIDCKPTKGIVTKRSNLKSFPTDIHFYLNEHSTYDRLQETELSINTPVLILHESKDCNWLFVKSPIYVGWVKKDNIAYAKEEDWQYFIYNNDFVTITEPFLKLGDILLDMSVKLPYQKMTEEYYQLILPSKGNDSFVKKSPVIVSNKKIHVGYLPYTKKNLLIQAFRYEGRLYRWGGMDDGVDCASYIANLFRTFGFIFQRNTSEQNHSIGSIISLQGKSSIEKLQILEKYPFGILYQPGHVMLYLGLKKGDPYIIHASGTAGKVVLTNLNEPNIYLSQIDKLVTIP